MNEKILIKEGRTLKLQDVLIREIPQVDLIDPTRVVYMMNSYILSKNIHSKGPLISYSCSESYSKGGTKLLSSIMLQLDANICVDVPYEFQDNIIEMGCLFARFNGKRMNIHYAYQKLGVYAFENEVNLRGDNYTVFTNEDSKEYITADIFFPVL